MGSDRGRRSSLQMGTQAWAPPRHGDEGSVFAAAHSRTLLPGKPPVWMPPTKLPIGRICCGICGGIAGGIAGLGACGASAFGAAAAGCGGAEAGDFAPCDDAGPSLRELSNVTVMALPRRGMSLSRRLALVASRVHDISTRASMPPPLALATCTSSTLPSGSSNALSSSEEQPCGRLEKRK